MSLFGPSDVRAPHGAHRSQRLRGWRRIANAVWSPPDDPQIYGLLEIDATELVELTRTAKSAGIDVTPTHFVGRAVAHALADVPGLNVRLRLHRIVPRTGVSLFFITSLRGGRDLGGVRVDDAECRSVVEVADALFEGAERQRRGDDDPTRRGKRVGELLPRSILRPALRMAAFAAGELGLRIPLLGFEPEPFGSAMISSLGALGLPRALVPLAWLYRVPLIVAPGTIEDRPVAVGKRVEVRPVLPISVTIDHRYVDGAELSGAWRALRTYLENPGQFEPALVATLAARAAGRSAPHLASPVA